MKWKTTHPQKRLRIVASITLALGLASSVMIYLSAENVPDTILGYEVEESKKYIHDLELYGGKANVLAAEFMNWFDGLWHGKSLAFTVGCIITFIALGIFFVAHHIDGGKG